MWKTSTAARRGWQAMLMRRLTRSDQLPTCPGNITARRLLRCASTGSAQCISKPWLEHQVGVAFRQRGAKQAPRHYATTGDGAAFASHRTDTKLTHKGGHGHEDNCDCFIAPIAPKVARDHVNHTNSLTKKPTSLRTQPRPTSTPPTACFDAGPRQRRLGQQETRQPMARSWGGPHKQSASAPGKRSYGNGVKQHEVSKAANTD